jgi:hypothetical protein
MSQAELIRAVSRATCESVSEIRRRGFQLLDAMPPEDDGELFGVPPNYVDWDHLAAQRVSIYS